MLKSLLIALLAMTPLGVHAATTEPDHDCITIDDACDAAPDDTPIAADTDSDVRQRGEDLCDLTPIGHVSEAVEAAVDDGCDALAARDATPVLPPPAERQRPPSQVVSDCMRELPAVTRTRLWRDLQRRSATSESAAAELVAVADSSTPDA